MADAAAQDEYSLTHAESVKSEQGLVYQNPEEKARGSMDFY
ncbi:hypothetical protein KNP414_06568 [Paenibacillus mucilaginosus KNP414]|uniref:Uncharacterized protein n=1 Tax=Paenibacillus mucilaginosus (strain KNP414) TaxID=1036673 RepID=F8F764_PAEMK|nr:hypothetical protein KNP414_06568 [Paenibacillus mucilaginosus KNP414]